VVRTRSTILGAVVALVATFAFTGTALASPQHPVVVSATVSATAPTADVPFMPYSVHPSMDACIDAQKVFQAENPDIPTSCWEDTRGPKAGMVTL
jgi:hypothetical protein